MNRLCLECGNRFITYPSRIKIGEGKYCSKHCANKNTLNGFKKGYIPTSEHRSNMSLVRIGKPSPNKGKRYVKQLGYSALHKWVYKNLGKASVCEFCGSKKRVEWANKSHLYLEKLSDWIQLCHKCHSKYDREYRLLTNSPSSIK